MQGHLCVENTASWTSGNSITSRNGCKALQISFSFTQQFHLDCRAWNEPWPPESPLTPPSPLLPQQQRNQKVKRGARMKPGPPAAPCASVANFQNSLTFLLKFPTTFSHSKTGASSILSQTPWNAEKFADGKPTKSSEKNTNNVIYKQTPASTTSTEKPGTKQSLQSTTLGYIRANSVNSD